MKKTVIKRDGSVSVFDKDALYSSLRRAGAEKHITREIVDSIYSEMKDGATTDEIYSKAFDMLNSRSKEIAMRYSLRRALFSLGPTGFPFEKFVAELFRRKGYEATTNVILKGHCISHEVDVFAQNKKERIAIEVKFHNDIKIRSDVKTALYLKSRFDDLMRKSMMGKKPAADKCILITNTKFTTNAIKYSVCSSVNLIGWSYPKGGDNLQKLIEEVDAHPVTCLPSVSKGDLEYLYQNNILTCRDLIENYDNLNKKYVNENMKKEAGMLCNENARKV